MLLASGDAPKRLLGLIAVGLFIGLAAPGAVAQSAELPDRSLCRSLCESEKQQCRTSGGAADAASTAGAVGLLGLINGQPKAFVGTESTDAKRDMRELLDAKQRAADDAKLARRETDDKCNSAYLKCLGACLPDAPNTTTTPP
jgi:hypothetical protein